MFRFTPVVRAVNARNVNQAARKAAAAMDQVRRKVQEAKLAKELRQTVDDDVITDKHVLEAYKELEEEKRAEAKGISVHALRHHEGRGGKSYTNYNTNTRRRGEEDDEFGSDGFIEGGKSHSNW